MSALPKIITTGFKAIQLIYFFTAGEDEVKCWQIRKGTKAPQARRTSMRCLFQCPQKMEGPLMTARGLEEKWLASRSL